MSKLGFGIIGTGGIARAHAFAIENCSDARLVAVHDAIPERAATFAAEYGVVGEADLQAFLSREDLDAVTIGTPSGAHSDCAIPAAEAGKHILCEKPLDVTVEKIDRLIEACDRNKVVLAGVFQMRLNDHICRIRQAIDSGRFGRLLLLSFQARWLRTQKYYDSAAWRGTWALDGGGALMNQSIHFVDLLLYLGGPAKSVYAITDMLTHENIEVEDNAVACVRFANGAMGTIEASTSCAPGFPRRLEISGDRGSVVLEGDRLTRWTFVNETDEDKSMLETANEPASTKSGKADPMAISYKGHARQVQDFVDAILEGREPAVPGREGRRSVELICAIYESARTGKPVFFEA